MWFLLCLLSILLSSATQKKPSHMIDVTVTAKKCSPHAAVKEISIHMNQLAENMHKYSFACGYHKRRYASCPRLRPISIKRHQERPTKVKASQKGLTEDSKQVKKEDNGKCYMVCIRSEEELLKNTLTVDKARTEAMELHTDRQCFNLAKKGRDISKAAKCLDQRPPRKYQVPCNKDDQNKEDCSWKFRCNKWDSTRLAEKAVGMRKWKNSKTKRIQFYCCKMECWGACFTKRYFSAGSGIVTHRLSQRDVLIYVKVTKGIGKDGTSGYFVAIHQCSECTLSLPPVPVPVLALVIGDGEATEATTDSPDVSTTTYEPDEDSTTPEDDYSFDYYKYNY